MIDENPIEKVFALAGGRSALMRALGLSKQTMTDWLRAGSVPVKHCPAVARLTGLALDELNPAFDVPGLRAKAKKHREKAEV